MSITGLAAVGFDNMSYRRIFTAVLLLAAIAVIEWLMVPTPAAIKPGSIPDVPWKIPTLAAGNSKDALGTLTSINLWGKLADNVQPDEGDPEWRFLGAMIRGNERHVVIKKENQPEQTLVPGDILPGGSKIVSIESDRLCLLINGTKRSLYIYPQGRLSGKMANATWGTYGSDENAWRVARISR